ncbi:MAG: efflux RND transporter periplasmic adaptor subunit [Acidobacteria bacterium]|nr:efflux RND transporter periplasmic adaptor subunit [Acidobacteriota bacterium]
MNKTISLATCPLALATCLLALALAGCNKQPPVQAKQADSGPIAVRVAPVTTRQVQRSVDSVGTLFPYDEAIISAEIEGRVDDVKADLGDMVKEGQVVAHVSDEEQRYLLAQNEAQMRQSLERLGLKNEKDRVRDIKETPEVRRAQAEALDAEQRFKRVRELRDSGIGSQADMDQAQTRFQALQAAYDATLNQTRNLIQEVERFKAVVDLQRKKLRDTTVRAPFNAYVKERQVAIGQYVRPNAPLFTLVKTDPVRFRMEVPERMSPWVRVGQIADVSIEAFADRKFQGKIWRISPTVDQQKRTFIVEALINNPKGELKPGSYARAHIPTEKNEVIRTIPFRGVLYVLGSNKAFVVKEDKIESRDLKLGDRFDADVEVLEGLEEGETIAVSSLPRLDTGVKVRVATGEEAPAKGGKAKAE